MPHELAIATNGQTLRVNASVSHWTSAALAAAASGTNDVESTTTTTITSDYSLFFADTATTATVTVTQVDGTTLFSKTLEVGPGVGTRRIAPLPDDYQLASDVTPMSSAAPADLAAGIIGTHPRHLLSTTSTMTSGVMRVSCFTAPRTMLVASVAAYVGGTAAGATPTLVRYGIYTMAANDDAALVASTTNDTALLATINSRAPKALTTPYTITKGSRYAIGLLVVTGAAAPIVATVPPLIALVGATLPRLNWEVTGQTDLPASVAVASQSTSAAQPYYELSL